MMHAKCKQRDFADRSEMFIYVQGLSPEDKNRVYLISGFEIGPLNLQRT